MGVFGLVQGVVLGFWTLITSHFSTTATVIDDVESGTWEQEASYTTVASDEETAYAPIPHILFTSPSSVRFHSYTSAISLCRTHVASPALRKRMFSPTTDTVASNLWRSLVRYGNRSAFTEPQRAQPAVVRPFSPAQDSLFGDNNNSNDASELPYLCVDLEDSEADSPTSSEGDSSLDRFDRRLLSSLLFEDSDSDDDSTIASSIESLRSQDDVCPAPRMPHSSRPILKLETSSYAVDVESSSPSPVDSGYGSRPDTPFIEKDAVTKMPEALSPESSPLDECSPIVFSQNPAVAASPEETHASLADRVLGAKPVANVAQGHIIPRIVLTDEVGRMVDLTYDAEELNHAEDPTDSAYGGLMSVVEEEYVAPLVLAPAPTSSRVPANMKMKDVAAGAVVDRVFVSAVPSRARLAHFTATPVYNNCRRAPTLILDSVGEEEEEEEERAVEDGHIGVAGSTIPEEEEEEAVAEEVETVVEDIVADETILEEEDGVKCVEVEVLADVAQKAEEGVEQLSISAAREDDVVGTKVCKVWLLWFHFLIYLPVGFRDFSPQRSCPHLHCDHVVYLGFHYRCRG